MGVQPSARSAWSTAARSRRGSWGGAIVNISSINARQPPPMVVDYSAHKAALTNLTTALSEEFAPRGVRVNTVSPGPMGTGTDLVVDGGTIKTS